MRNDAQVAKFAGRRRAGTWGRAKSSKVGNAASKGARAALKGEILTVEADGALSHQHLVADARTDAALAEIDAAVGR